MSDITHVIRLQVPFGLLMLSTSSPVLWWVVLLNDTITKALVTSTGKISESVVFAHFCVYVIGPVIRRYNQPDVHSLRKFATGKIHFFNSSKDTKWQWSGVTRINCSKNRYSSETINDTLNINQIHWYEGVRNENTLSPRTWPRIHV